MQTSDPFIKLFSPLVYIPPATSIDKPINWSIHVQCTSSAHKSTKFCSWGERCERPNERAFCDFLKNLEDVIHNCYLFGFNLHAAECSLWIRNAFRFSIVSFFSCCCMLFTNIVHYAFGLHTTNQLIWEFISRT